MLTHSLVAMYCLILLGGLVTVSGTQRICLNPPPDPENGRVLSDEGHPGAAVLYTCNRGYRLRGSSVRRCRLPGYWDGATPRCDFVGECRILNSPKNGYVIAPENTMGAFAFYDCTVGYTLVGSHTRQCLGDLKWSGSEPTCVHGAPVCGDLSPIANGKVHYSGTTAGSVAYYTCKEGFILLGYRQRTCYHDARWSNEEPQCKKRTRLSVCSPLGHIANGHVQSTGNASGSIATYTCNFGYRLIGGRTRECCGGGSWSGSSAFCQLRVKICDDLDAPLNGGVNMEGNLPGSTATYTCDGGFFLDGNSSRVCVGLGEWSGSAPTCVRTCSTLPSIPNGRVDLTGLFTDSVAMYSCDNGYTLVGYRQRRCQSDGTWQDYAEPECKIRSTCAPPSIRNGGVHVMGEGVGSYSNYTCIIGFMLVGNRKRECLRNGTWSGTKPVCKRKAKYLCSVPPPIRNGRVNVTDIVPHSVVTYTCNVGFRLVGSSVRACRSYGDWSHSEPVCKRLAYCGNLVTISHGKVHYNGITSGSVAYYSCDRGYTLDKYRPRYCQENKVWSGDKPYCRCTSLIPLVHGRVDVRGSIPGIVLANYTCKEGYMLLGDTLRICDDYGHWPGAEPVCVSAAHSHNTYLVLECWSVLLVCNY